jgi:hypothetical protein
MNESVPLSALGGSVNAPAGKFTDIGDKHAGRLVTPPVERQQTDLDRNPLVWPDGTKRTEWLFTIEEDSGERVTLYARRGNYSGNGLAMLDAIIEAVTEAGADAIEVGGKLAVVYSGTQSLGSGKTAKLYKAQYQPPAPASVPMDLFTQ